MVDKSEKQKVTRDTIETVIGWTMDKNLFLFFLRKLCVWHVYTQALKVNINQQTQLLKI